MTNKKHLKIEVIRKISFLLLVFIGIFSCAGKSEINESKGEVESSPTNKIDSIIRIYSGDNPEMPYLRHELLDLNYDHADDIVIYFGGSGTGVFQVVKVYTYDKGKHDYYFDKKLGLLENPSFYKEDKLITTFNIGHGNGYGLKRQWINNKWDTTEYIEFNPHPSGEASWLVSIENYQTHKTTTKTIENFQLPPPEILPTNY